MLSAIYLVATTLAVLTYIKFAVFCVEGILPFGKDAKEVISVFICIVGTGVIGSASWVGFLAHAGIEL